jgi:hypothetical protein
VLTQRLRAATLPISAVRDAGVIDAGCLFHALIKNYGVLCSAVFFDL